ncbi:MAG: hypothetical protein U5Q16_16270 [Gammaproteobacteria bacterium]|nr:hypothetical protein [Gammaproteobacteria bacterium]
MAKALLMPLSSLPEPGNPENPDQSACHWWKNDHPRRQPEPQELIRIYKDEKGIYTKTWGDADLSNSSEKHGSVYEWIRRIYEWVIRWAKTPYGSWALFI